MLHTWKCTHISIGALRLVLKDDTNSMSIIFIFFYVQNAKNIEKHSAFFSFESGCLEGKDTLACAFVSVEDTLISNKN